MAPTSEPYDPSRARTANEVWQYFASRHSELAKEFAWLPSALTQAKIEPAGAESPHTFYISLFNKFLMPELDPALSSHARAARLIGVLGFPNALRDPSDARHDAVDHERLKALAIECEAHGVDFSKGLDDLAKRGDSMSWALLNPALLLYELGVIDPGRWLHVDTFHSLGAEATRACRPIGWKVDALTNPRMDLASPAFWYFWHPEAIAHVVLPALRAATTESAALIARGVLAAGVHPTHRTPALTRASTAFLYEISSDLESRLDEFPHKSPVELRLALLGLWHLLLSAARRGGRAPSKSLIAIAQYDIACWRQLFQRSTDADASRHFRSGLTQFDTSVALLFSAGYLWDAIRPLILALRALITPAVATDLSYWHSRIFPSEDTRAEMNPMLRPGDDGYVSPYGWAHPHKPDPPEPWRFIPDELMSWFHSEVAREQESDPSLENLRQQFARFCLDRLKFDKRLGRQVEADPRWRIGFIRAAAELRINPRGTGHRTLYEVANSDVEPSDVREAARTAYAQMRRSAGLGRMSPRTAFVRAYACLLRAHLESLGTPVDEQGAQSTIAAMVRRTTKPIEEVTREDTWF